MAIDEQRTNHERVEKLIEMIDRVDVAMMTTVEPDGTLRSRPMMTQQGEDDGTLWFITDEHSPKVSEIENDRKVNLSYSDPDSDTYVSISGIARVVEDRSKIEELWNPTLKAWFPKGKDDPNICLLKVEPEKGEYWDVSSSTLVQVVGLAKALFTGERMKDAGDHGKVTL